MRKQRKLQIIHLLIFFLVPTILYSGGPVQPEFANFESVMSTEMVNEFTGDFTYNLPILTVPGPDGSSYSISLSYRSGISPSDDATWVGYGWNLNPGSIVRQLRGFPDEYHNTEVIYWNKQKPNLTAIAFTRIGLEFCSSDLKEISNSRSYQINNIFNTYTGFSNYKSFGLGFGNWGSLSYGWKNNGEKNFGYTFNFGFNFLDFFNLKYNIDKEGDLSEKEKQQVKYVNDRRKAFNNIGSSITTSFLNPPSYPTVLSETITSINRFRPSIRVDGIWGLGLDLESAFSYETITNSSPCFGRNSKTVYGYIYSGEALSDDNNIMDYSVENESPFTTRDQYLPIPFSNYDIFMVNGEGIGGSFRFYNDKIGTFRPNHTKSTTTIQGVNLTINGGPTPPHAGAGVDFTAFADKNTESSTWFKDQFIFDDFYKFFNPYPQHFRYENKIVDRTFAQNGIPESVYPRFLNDLGGSIGYYQKKSTQSFEDYRKLVEEPIQLGFTNKENEYINENTFKVFGSNLPIAAEDGLLKSVNNSNRVGRSNYISFTTNNEIFSEAYPNLSSNELNLNISQYTQDDRESSSTWEIENNNNPYGMEVNKSGIGEYSITNNKGMRYNYGLPVYNRNERELSYGLTELTSKNFTNLGGDGEGIKDNYLVFKSITPHDYETNNQRVVMGMERNEPYAGMYLLTSITSPGFIDNNLDGPDRKDFGAYTKFNYRRVYGSDIKRDQYVEQWDNVGGYSSVGNPSPNQLSKQWYKWRIPYKGMFYKRNSLSDPLDDIGVVSMGEREVYYLETIETKTHIAIFVTNKFRKNYLLSTDEEITISGSGQDRKDLLDASHNEYNVTGNSNYNPDGEGNQLEYLERIELYSTDKDGKLLKKLRTVLFYQTYALCENQPNSMKIDSTSETRFGKLTLEKVWFEDEETKKDSISPYIFIYNYPTAYSAPYTHLSDNYSSIPQLYQNPDFEYANIDRWGYYRKNGLRHEKNFYEWIDQKASDFDPAAWHLKRIIQPTGGSIDVQYEQKEYSHVHNREAMCMVKLAKDPPFNFDKSKEVVINLGETTIDQVYYQEYVTELKKYFTVSGENAYFKFLYALVNGEYGTDIKSCHPEFIDGYCGINDITFQSHNGQSYAKITFCDENGTMFPTKLCQDYAINQRNGVIPSGECNCDPIEKNIFRDKYIDQIDIVKELASKRNYGEYLDREDFCKAIDYENSYVRLPLLEYSAKKGGGIRVKRLLFVDNFNNNLKIYGKEYIYKRRDDKSSGVATNEPGIGKKENSLIIDYPKRSSQGSFEKYLGGQDLEQFELPFGETLLPSPNIGYSSVFVKSISEGLTSSGLSHKEYYTVRDYPYDMVSMLTPNNEIIKGVNISPIKTYGKTQLPDLNFGIFNYSTSRISSLQSYSFIKNNMHGQIKSLSNYSGDWDAVVIKGLPPSNRIEYNYFQPGEEIPLFYDSGKFTSETEALSSIQKQFPGRDMEIICESRKVDDYSSELNVDLDCGITFPIAPYFTGCFSYSLSDHSIQTYVTNKIINYPVLLKSVTSISDGIISKNEILAYDPQSGEQSIARTSDEFYNEVSNNKALISYQFFGSAQYPALNQKAINEKAVISHDINALDTNYLIRRHANDQYYLVFKKTDSKDDDILCHYFDKFSEGDLIQIRSKGSSHSYSKPEYYHVKKVQAMNLVLTPLMGFTLDIPIDDPVDVQIIRSGKKNQLDIKVGSLITYDEGIVGKLIKKELAPPETTITNQKKILRTLNKMFESIHLTPDVDICQGYNYSGNPSGETPQKKASEPEFFIDFNGDSISDSNDYDFNIKYQSYDGSCKEVPALTLLNSIRLRQMQFDPDRTNSQCDPSDADDPLDHPEHCVEIEIELLDDVVNTTFPNDLEHMFLYDLNQLLNRSYLLRLDREIEDYDWNKLLGSYNDNMGNAERYFTAELNEEQERDVINKILDETGFNNITKSVYNIGGEYLAGKDLIQLVPDSKIYVIADKKEKKVFLASMKIRLINDLFEEDFWFGILRQTFKDAGSAKCTASDDGGFYLSDEFGAQIPIPGYEVTSSDDDNVFFNPTGKYTEQFGKFTTYDGKIKFSVLPQSIQQEIVDESNPKIIFQNGIPEILCKTQICHCICNQGNVDFPFYLDDENNLRINFDLNMLGPNGGPCYHIVNNPVTKIDEDHLNLKNTNILHSDRLCEDFCCLRFCPEEHRDIEVKNVIAATAMSLSDDWDYETSVYSELESCVNVNSEYSTGIKGQWRPDSLYIYRDIIDPGSDKSLQTLNRIVSYNPYKVAGKFSNDFYLFNWKSPVKNQGRIDGPTSWKLNQVYSKYTPNGNVSEERDIIGNPGTTKYSPITNSPILVASNSEYDEVLFESYEEIVSSSFSLYDSIAHTGRKSLILNQQPNPNTFYPVHDGTIRLSYKTLETGNGLVIRYWVKLKYDSIELNPTSLSSLPQVGEIFTLRVQNASASQTFIISEQNKIAKTGEWSLYELQIPSNSITAFQPESTVSFSISKHTRIPEVWIDDFRIQPIKSEMVAYIYDRDFLRLQAILDDQNFAKAYQYNDEGKLVRIRKETYQGWKTVSEAQYNKALKLGREEGFSNKTSSKLPSDELPLHYKTNLPSNESQEQTPGLNGTMDVFDLKLNQDGLDYQLLEGIPIKELFKMRNNLPDQIDSLEKELQESGLNSEALKIDSVYKIKEDIQKSVKGAEKTIKIHQNDANNELIKTEENLIKGNKKLDSLKNDNIEGL